MGKPIKNTTTTNKTINNSGKKVPVVGEETPEWNRSTNIKTMLNDDKGREALRLYNDSLNAYNYHLDPDKYYRDKNGIEDESHTVVYDSPDIEKEYKSLSEKFKKLNSSNTELTNSQKKEWEDLSRRLDYLKTNHVTYKNNKSDIDLGLSKDDASNYSYNGMRPMEFVEGKSKYAIDKWNPRKVNNSKNVGTKYGTGITANTESNFFSDTFNSFSQFVGDGINTAIDGVNETVFENTYSPRYEKPTNEIRLVDKLDNSNNEQLSFKKNNYPINERPNVTVDRIPLKGINQVSTKPNDIPTLKKQRVFKGQEYERKGTSGYPGVNIIYDRSTHQPSYYINKEGDRSPYGEKFNKDFQYKNGGKIKNNYNMKNKYLYEFKDGGTTLSKDTALSNIKDPETRNYMNEVKGYINKYAGLKPGEGQPLNDFYKKASGVYTGYKIDSENPSEDAIKLRDEIGSIYGKDKKSIIALQEELVRKNPGLATYIDSDGNEQNFIDGKWGSATMNALIDSQIGTWNKVLSKNNNSATIGKTLENSEYTSNLEIEPDSINNSYVNPQKVEVKYGGNLTEYGNGGSFGDWVSDNKDYIIGGTKIAAGTALSFTGLGAAAGMPLIASGAGDIATGVSGDMQDRQNAADERFAAPPTMQPMLSDVKMARYGGNLTELNTGETHAEAHANGRQSIPLGASGNLSSFEDGGNPQGSLGNVSVERGETISKAQEEPHVHSNAFKISAKDAADYGLPKSSIGKTPAEYSKSVSSMFKRDNDKYEDKDLQALMTNLERYSAEKGREKNKGNQMKYGGNLKEMIAGGPIDVDYSVFDDTSSLNYNRGRGNLSHSLANSNFQGTDIARLAGMGIDVAGEFMYNKKPKEQEYQYQLLTPERISYNDISAQPYLNQNASTYNSLNQELQDSSGGSAGRYRAGLLASSVQKSKMDSDVLARANQFNVGNRLSVDSANAEAENRARQFNSQMNYQSKLDYLSDLDTFRNRRADTLGRTGQNTLNSAKEIDNRRIAGTIAPEYDRWGNLKNP